MKNVHAGLLENRITERQASAFPRRRLRPGDAADRPRKQEGAGKAGHWPRPWPASKQKKLAADTTGLAEASRPSLRDGFNAYSALSPGTGLSCSRRPAARHRTTWPQRREARTTRLRVRAGIVRRRGNRAATRHVHRIPRSTSVTIAIRPSSECGMAG